MPAALAQGVIAEGRDSRSIPETPATTGPTPGRGIAMAEPERISPEEALRRYGKTLDEDEPGKKGNGSDTSKPSPDAATGGAVQLDDFVAYMPQHSYIFRPTGELWPAASVNARIPPVIDRRQQADRRPASGSTRTSPSSR